MEKCLTILDTFGQIFGLYPFINEKYGIYQFEFGGGMEHQTNVGQGAFDVWLTAHELSHQWWGDAITCRTWHDVWLNEGFATYAEALWKEHRPGSAGEPALHNWMALRRPGRVNDSVYCYDTSNWGRVFSTDFSYRKGAWVLHQLRHVVGDSTFFEILAAYRAAFEGSAATTDDFAAVASSVHGQDLAWFFDQWVYQVGAPAYRYGWQTAQINGQHYLRLHINQTQNGSWPTFQMPLDVRVDHGAGSETQVVFNDARAEHFVLPVGGAATNVALDPLDWVLHTACSQETYVAGPPVIVQTAPLPGELVLPADAPAQLTVTFSEDVVCELTDFAVAEEISGPVAFTYVYAPADYTATLFFDQPLAIGTYMFTVKDDVITPSALSLDGEIDDPLAPQSLPSGDGLPGGDASFTFFVRCPGDIDSDLDVDLDDVHALLEHYNTPAGATYEQGDLDHDGDVDLADLAELLGCYGTTC
jgi:hypothetical protein